MAELSSQASLYTSKCSVKNFFQKYEIFDDHLQLHIIFGNFSVPFSEIERAEVFPASLVSLRLHLRNFRWLGAKLDLSDFSEHILLDKSTGLIRQLLFTPDNPAEFKVALDHAMRPEHLLVDSSAPPGSAREHST